ncbi:hypothetical protein ACOSQ4_003940 [Xanthoceras sorbifolium]
MEDPRGRAVTGYPVHVPTAYSKSTATATTVTAATAASTVIDRQILGCVCTLMLILCFLIALIVDIVYIEPPFKSPEFEIHSLTVRPINISSSHITGEWGTRMAVINPNNWTHYVQEIEAEIFYKQCLVTSKRMEPFCNDGNVMQFLEENFDVSSEFIGRLCANSIEMDWLRRGKTNFTLILRSVIKNIIDPYVPVSQGSIKITAKCNEIEVEFSSNSLMGSMVGDMRDCDVNSQILKN